MTQIEEALKQSQAMNQLLLEMTKSQKESNKATVRILIVSIVCYTMLLITLIIGFLWYESKVVNTQNSSSIESSYEDFDSDYLGEYALKRTSRAIFPRGVSKSTPMSRSYTNSTLKSEKRVC